MKVLIDISKEELDRIKMLLSTKKINSVSHFVSLAIQNQIELENENYDIPNLESLVHYDSSNHNLSIEKKANEQSVIDPKRIQIVDPVNIRNSFPFWGTQNKYLCLKQISVDFSKLASSDGEPWIRYDIVINILLKNAVLTRQRFEEIDKLLHINRGEKISTGFPKNDSKSMTRYEKQFIGGIDGNDNYYGMSVLMGFLAVRKNQSSNRMEFGITEDGLKFSKLDSPIFNKNNDQMTPTTPHLSDNEIQFILSILKKRNNDEMDLMKFTLGYIMNGKNHPEDGKTLIQEYLNKKYQDLSRNKSEGTFSILEAETIRAGVISRLNELGLIKIIKKGLKSEYTITDLGKKIIES